MRVFFDTNVLLYLVDEKDRRHRTAQRLVDDNADGHISVQVLNEFTVVARKLQRPWLDIRADLDLLKSLFDAAPLTLGVHERGIDISERYGYRIFDSLLLASALDLDCSTFWTEDLHNGQIIEGRLTIRNPFQA